MKCRARSGHGPAVGKYTTDIDPEPIFACFLCVELRWAQFIAPIQASPYSSHFFVEFAPLEALNNPDHDFWREEGQGEDVQASGLEPV